MCGCITKAGSLAKQVFTGGANSAGLGRLRGGIDTMAKKQNTASHEERESLVGRVSRFTAYVEDSRGEMRKITWPTLKETRSAVFVVLGFVAVMALLLGVVDFCLSRLIQFILS